VLPLPSVHGPAMLEIHLAGTMIYLEEGGVTDGIDSRAA